ncbi:TRAP transporter small permease [Anaerotruncus rubiinfantis]|uniref:TRAP transporter small permease n=1 Tax=Anaerotruncus rubiinfantis TaxID=1720200 RepID=UPI00082AAF65|nr:TRAP transporter small permease [Anaerotruncus rubiinfantis]
MKKFYKTLCKIEESICGFFLCTIVALVFLSAVGRVINHPLQWSIDISQFLLAWTALLGADLGYRSGSVLGVDILTRRFPTRQQALVKLLGTLLIGALLISFIYFGIKLSYENRLRLFQSIHLSYSWVTISLPVMSSLMLISVAADAWDAFLVLIGKKDQLMNRRA